VIGVAVVGMDRPHYLRRTLAGLAQQRDAPPFEVHLWLDGAVNEWSGRVVGKASGIDACADVFKRAGLPRGRTFRQIRNIGIGLHQWKATEWMCQRYERVLMLEDDVVLSPHWLRLLDVLFEQFEGRDDVFGFCPGFKRLAPGEGTLLWRDEHWWAEGFTATAWHRARPYYRDYLNIIQGVDYAQRNHDAIRVLFARHDWGNPSTSQDSGKDLAIHRSGQRRVVCGVHRALGIGRTGVHFTPALFAARGYERPGTHIHDGDAMREAFDEPIDG